MENYNYLFKFDLCIKELNKRFHVETFDHNDKKHPELWKRLTKAEDRLNQFWDKDSSSFDKALVEFYKVVLKMINNCKNNT